MLGNFFFNILNLLFETIGFLKKLPLFANFFGSGNLFCLILITAFNIDSVDITSVVSFILFFNAEYDILSFGFLLSLYITSVITILCFSLFLKIESRYLNSHSSLLNR